MRQPTPFLCLLCELHCPCSSVWRSRWFRLASVSWGEAPVLAVCCSNAFSCSWLFMQNALWNYHPQSPPMCVSSVQYMRLERCGPKPHAISSEIQACQLRLMLGRTVTGNGLLYPKLWHCVMVGRLFSIPIEFNVSAYTTYTTLYFC